VTRAGEEGATGKKPLPRVLYLIKRGPRPDYHRATFAPVILCTSRPVAQWEAGATSELATVWQKYHALKPYGGWLLVRWRGLDIDFGHIVRSMPLPDGTTAAIVHDTDEEPWTLLGGAVWWSHTHRVPEWLAGRVAEPDDDSHESIDTIEDYAARDDPARLRATRPW
jgi:hypothetical protein